jgi:hypothetical protein
MPVAAGVVASASLLLAAPATAQVVFTDSNLPIVVIDTEGQTIPDEPKIDVFMGLIYNGPGQRNYLTDPFNEYEGRVGIELRGASSQQFPKKSYAFETRDAQGANLNVSLLGMPEENDWILHGPYSDKTLLRNVLTFELAADLGWYASRTRYCELVLNDDYRGVYVLMEKIKRDRNRVNIEELEPFHISGDELTGGYIIKIDKPVGSEIGGWYSTFPPFPGGPLVLYQYHFPKPTDIVPAQEAYIQDFVFQFESLMDSTGYNDPLTGYYGTVDLASFVDHFIVTELARNVDGYRLSTFLYKDRDSVDGRLVIGPFWDFNLAYGNAQFGNGWDTAGWQVDFQSPVALHPIPFWWQHLVDDAVFRNRVACRWQEQRSSLLHVDSLLSRIDVITAELAESQVRNFERWPILGTYVWPNWFIGETYEEEIEFVSSWLTDRIAWLDANLPTPEACVEWAPSVSVHGVPGEPVALPIAEAVLDPAGADSVRFASLDPRLVVSQDPQTVWLTASEAGELPFRGMAWKSGSVVDISPDYVFRATSGDVVINEIMYKSAAVADSRDWIELCNPGSMALEISGWMLGDDDPTHRFMLPPGTEVPEDGHLVVVRDIAAFVSVYPWVTDYIGELGFGFGPDDEVRLYDADSLLVDFVDYSNQPPWPTEPDGGGPSLELLDPFLDNALPESWRASLAPYGSPGEANNASAGAYTGLEIVPPAAVVLQQNVPNPFNPHTSFSFELRRSTAVTLRVMTAHGRIMRTLYENERIDAGRHRASFDGKDDAGRDLPSGVYFVDLRPADSPAERQRIKITLVR